MRPSAATAVVGATARVVCDVGQPPETFGWCQDLVSVEGIEEKIINNGLKSLSSKNPMLLIVPKRWKLFVN